MLIEINSAVRPLVWLWFVFWISLKEGIVLVTYIEWCVVVLQNTLCFERCSWYKTVVRLCLRVSSLLAVLTWQQCKPVSDVMCLLQLCSLCCCPAVSCDLESVLRSGLC